MDDLVKAMGASGVSKSQVSRLIQEIDERAHARLARPIAAAEHRQAVGAILETIFARQTAKEAHAQRKVLADALLERPPKLAEPMDNAREDVLA